MSVISINCACFVAFRILFSFPLVVFGLLFVQYSSIYFSTRLPFVCLCKNSLLSCFFLYKIVFPSLFAMFMLVFVFFGCYVMCLCFMSAYFAMMFIFKHGALKFIFALQCSNFRLQFNKLYILLV
jgi:hypothetical protein